MHLAKPFLNPLKAKVFILTVAAAAALIFCSAASAQTADEKTADHFQRTFNLNSGGTLVVDNYKGTIHVTGTDGNQVVVDVRKQFDGRESDRKWWMENLEIKFHNDSSRVEVAVKYPSYTCIFCVQIHDYTAAVELEIRVPRQTSVKIDSYKPEIRINGTQGDIRIDSYKSPIIIESTTGSIRIDTYKDTIKLRDVTLRGSLEVKSYKADTEIFARSLGDNAQLETEKGSILLRVPHDAGFELDFSGGRHSSFHSDFSFTTDAGRRGDNDVRGTVNKGGARVRVRTERGSVSLERASL
jgi:putative adhesin